MQILLVDDSQTMRRILKNTLTKAGYNGVLEAENGKEGLEILKEKKPDLVLLDWNMPVMNGLEFLKAAKAEESVKHIPVIMVTSISEKEKVVEAIRAGAADYTTKPFSPQTIKEKIQNQVGTST